jgi:hypothetical protein
MAPKPLDMGPYMVVRAKEKGDAELLATLKAQWQALKAEM